jgi:hypothetical protein
MTILVGMAGHGKPECGARGWESWEIVILTLILQINFAYRWKPRRRTPEVYTGGVYVWYVLYVRVRRAG